MTPQDSFMILAAIDPHREHELRELLASMNDGPGQLKPNNPILHFEQFEQLHFARALILADQTTGDVRAYGLEPRNYALYFALLGDVDGDGDAFLRDLASREPAGLRA